MAGQAELLTLQTVIQIAVQDNPNLAQMLARSVAMAIIPIPAGTLPEPIISFNALNLPVDSFDTVQENMAQLQDDTSPAFPFPGKLALREQAAQNVSEAR